jgi:hypothetical protein
MRARNQKILGTGNGFWPGNGDLRAQYRWCSLFSDAAKVAPHARAAARRFDLVDGQRTLELLVAVALAAPQRRAELVDAGGLAAAGFGFQRSLSNRLPNHGEHQLPISPVPGLHFSGNRVYRDLTALVPSSPLVQNLGIATTRRPEPTLGVMSVMAM